MACPSYEHRQGLQCGPFKSDVGASIITYCILFWWLLSISIVYWGPKPYSNYSGAFIESLEEEATLSGVGQRRDRSLEFAEGLDFSCFPHP